MRKLLVVLRELDGPFLDSSVPPQSIPGKLPDRRVVPVESIRCVTVQPLVERRERVTLTAASLAKLLQSGVPQAVVTKLAPLKDVPFYGRSTFRQRLETVLTAEELLRHGSVINADAEAAPYNAALKLLAFLELAESAPRNVGDGTPPQNTPFATSYVVFAQCTTLNTAHIQQILTKVEEVKTFLSFQPVQPQDWVKEIQFLDLG